MINASIPNFRVPTQSACGGQCKCGGSCPRSQKAGDGADAGTPVRLSGPSLTRKTAAAESPRESSGKPPVTSTCGSGCGGDCSSCGIKNLLQPPSGLAEVRPPVKWAQD